LAENAIYMERICVEENCSSAHYDYAVFFGYLFFLKGESSIPVEA
jgi:hypothetical protein